MESQKLGLLWKGDVASTHSGSTPSPIALAVSNPSTALALLHGQFVQGTHPFLVIPTFCSWMLVLQQTQAIYRKFSTTFLGSILYSQAAVMLLAQVWRSQAGHR